MPDQPNDLNTFYFTPLESIILNAKMPFGLKLETEDNLSKTKDNSVKTMQKKSKKPIVCFIYYNILSLLFL